MCLSGFRLFSWAQIKEASFISQVSEWHSQLRWCFSYWEEYQAHSFMFCARWGTDFVSTSQNSGAQERLIREAALSWKAFDCIFSNPCPGSKEQKARQSRPRGFSFFSTFIHVCHGHWADSALLQRHCCQVKRSAMEESHLSTRSLTSGLFLYIKWTAIVLERWKTAVFEMEYQHTAYCGVH